MSVRLMAVSVLLAVALPAGSIHAQTFSFSIGRSGSGDAEFLRPAGVAVDAFGNIYVSDSGNHRIQRFNPNGSWAGLFGWGVRTGASTFESCSFNCRAGTAGRAGGQLDLNLGLSINRSYEVVVADADSNQTGSGINRISTYTANGLPLDSFGSTGTGNGQFIQPFTVAVDANDNTYVVDRAVGVQVFDQDGHFLRRVGTFGGGASSYTGPSNIAFNARGDVYITDTTRDKVLVFDAGGTFLFTFGSGGSGDGQFNQPTGIAIDDRDRVFVGEQSNNRIQTFAPDGQFLSKFGSAGTGNGQFNAMQQLAIDESDNLYVADYLNNRVQVFKLAATSSSSDGGSGDDGGGCAVATSRSSGTLPLLLMPTLLAAVRLLARRRR